MPSYQGIKLDVISQLELRIHPEFPHPETSQFTYRSTSTAGETSSSLVSSSVASDSKADKFFGRPSTISVYIPSFPGARFWLRYNVSGAVEPKAPWYYFKLFMNGRHITSWGTHSIFRPHGQVMRALYDPTARWNYKIDETVYKNCGNEIRPFYFSNVKGRSAADDGGLIEVRVFRAKGRRRRMPSPAEFKPQDHYGLVLPSTGLTEDSQEPKCYDWFLIDPTDKPFATFKFHYRSWDNLSMLHLIPSNHPRTLLFPSPSLLSLNGQSANALRKKDVLKRREDDGCGDSIGSFSSEGLVTPPRTSPEADSYDYESDSSREIDKGDALRVPRSPSPYYRNLSPSSLKALGYFAPPIPRIPSTAQLERAGILSRTLREIPLEKRALPQPSRRVSESSDSASITPSLKSHYGHYDRALFSPSPVAKTATATQFRKSKIPPKLIEVRGRSTQDHSQSTITDHPAPVSIALKQSSGRIFSGFSLRKYRKPSLTNYHSTSKMAGSSYNKQNTLRREKYKSYECGEDTASISVTESEWLSNVPLASHGKAMEEQAGRIRGLGGERSKSNAEGSALLREQAMDWYNSAAATESGLNSGSLRHYGELKPPGSWI